MAELVVSFVLNRIGDLLINEGKFLCGVKAQVENAGSELAWVLCFLKDADAYAKDGSDERLRKWVAEIRDAAYDLEDAIGTFALKVAYERSNTSAREHLLKTWLPCILTQGVQAHQVGVKIQGITAKLSNLRSMLQICGIRESRERTSFSSERQKELRRSYSHVVERDVVGFEEDIQN